MTGGGHVAFPIFNQHGETNTDLQGLTKRELFAAMAMQGMLATNPQFEGSTSENAVKLADKLIDALNKKETKE